MHLREHRLTEDQSDLSAYEKLAEQQLDDDTYDTEPDDEAEKLEGTLEKEKSSQVKWKVARWVATEAREQWTIVSQRE